MTTCAPCSTAFRRSHHHPDQRTAAALDSERAIARAVQRAKGAAKWDERDLHFHDLRGTAATKFYIAGLPVRVIAEIMGWEEETVEKIIRRYVGRHGRHQGDDRAAQRGQKGNIGCKTACKTSAQKPAKCWSG